MRLKCSEHLRAVILTVIASALHAAHGVDDDVFQHAMAILSLVRDGTLVERLRSA